MTEDDDLPGVGDPLPPRFTGTWNVWSTTSLRKMRTPFRNRASDKQLLANEIGDYKWRVTPALRKSIVAAIMGKTWYEIPLIVHRLVCPACDGTYACPECHARWHGEEAEAVAD